MHDGLRAQKQYQAESHETNGNTNQGRMDYRVQEKLERSKMNKDIGGRKTQQTKPSEQRG